MHLNSKAHIGRAICALAALILLLAAASAVAAGPEWRLRAIAPDGINDNKPVTIVGWVSNVGDVPLSGTLTITHTFPAGISPVDPEVRGGLGSSCQIVNQASMCDINVDGLVPGSDVRVIYNNAPVSGASGTLLDTIDAAGGGMATGRTVEQLMTVGEFSPFGVKQFAMDLSAIDRSPAAQAGSTPRELESTILLRSVATDQLGVGFQALFAPTEHLRDAVVHVPGGFVGNPNATPVKCTLGQLAEPSPLTSGQRIPNCPQNSQVGFVRVQAGLAPDEIPLYNLEPPPGSPAAFGFTYQALTVILTARLRPKDNGIDIVASKAVSSLPLSAVWVTMWGTPADSSHDTLRHLCMDGFEGNLNGASCPSDAQPKPFLRMPTSCSSGPLPWSADLTTYEHPSTAVHADTASAPVTGCELLQFDPQLTLTPTNTAPYGPTGLDATLTMPQDVGQLGLSDADLRTAVVTLPEGLAINASSADGLKACSDADLKLGQEGPSSCPDGAKIGTVTLTTPLLDHPLGGSIQLRTQSSDDPASGEMFRIAIEVRSDDDGIHLKLPGAVRVDPVTGRIVTTVDNAPQLPFSSMQLHFKSGPRAPLTTPRTCGVHSSVMQFTGWNGKPATGQSAFSLSGCAPKHLTPVFRAGSENPQPATRTPFQVSLRRDDSDEPFEGLTMETPTGLLGAIKDAERCGDAAANAGTCSGAAQIGRATVGAGTGSNPFYITDGKVFLTGPYKGAPYGLSVVVRAVAGPFDLGSVVVRAAIHIDRHTAALRVVSDPFPTVIKGVPTNLRTVRISVDKPGFMVTPTSCAQKSVDATVTSTTGLTAKVSSPYRLAGCRELSLAPKLKLSVGAPRRTSSVGVSTPFKATLTQSPGQSNLARVKVSLPTTLAALLPVVNRACTQTQFDTGRCNGSRVGSATARSPLLPHALRGGAFFVKHPGQPLPDLVVGLRGDVSIDLVGKVSIPGGKQLATDFNAIPDAPLSRFTLSLVAGRNGPLGVSRNLCTKQARRAAATVTMRGQNGATIHRHERLHISGCGGGKHRNR
jgi:hypothetical protein